MNKKIIICFIMIFIILCLILLLVILPNKKKTKYQIEDEQIVKNHNIDSNNQVQDKLEIDIQEDKELEENKNVNQEENNYSEYETIVNSSQSHNVEKKNTVVNVDDSNKHNEVTKVLTEWEKLGISEWDYYHTPAPNEGEIATNIIDCDEEVNNIITKYRLVAHSGDTYSYSDDYLGCWIVIIFSDNSKMFYNEFKSREKTGEFNYLLRNTN